MNHCGTVPLETARLVLRRFESSDAPAFFRNVCSDPKVSTYLTWKTHETPAETEALLTDFIRRYENPARYCWAIILKETNEVIGTVAAPTVHELTECVEVTYAVGSAWWGKGYAPEALKAVMDFLFDRVGVNRIEDFIQQCQARGWIVNRINVETKVNVYNQGQMELDLE